MRRTIAILGATGSIGTQALDLVGRDSEHFRAVCLTAYRSADRLFELVRKFRPRTAALVEQVPIPEDLRFCQWYFGKDSSVRALEASGAQDALCAIVGIAGLPTCLRALDLCERVLLANKEALVTGGSLVTERAAQLKKRILPVDSEHSAIFQCLEAANGNPVRRLILTCSGGALREIPLSDLKDAAPEQVLRHPTWNMGRKITVDCATMFNKGLEVMEAHWLFGMPGDRIAVVIHPQSVIHSMVEFEDGAILAQMGCPDMRGPIGYAMGYPRRIPYDAKPLDLVGLGSMTFSDPDPERYPCFFLALDAMKAGGNAPVVLNGANEEAVGAFLCGRIAFGAIADLLKEALDRVPQGEIRSADDVFAADRTAREAVLRSLM